VVAQGGTEPGGGGPGHPGDRWRRHRDGRRWAGVGRAGFGVRAATLQGQRQWKGGGDDGGLGQERKVGGWGWGIVGREE
jgi:hypothetical protein